VSSAAVEYVKGVFDHFGDKTILVIGAGKMGELTLKHLRALSPKRIVVTNRSPEKARQVAATCQGEAAPWEKLDEVMAAADVVLSTTGAPEPIMTAQRYSRIAARRRGPLVIIDVAVPRDFDPNVHDGECTFLFNIDDLKEQREQTLKLRRKHVADAEAIVEEESARFSKVWAQRKNGPTIERLTRDADRMTEEVFEEVKARLNGRLSDADREYLKMMFHRLKSRFLHRPISALREETQRTTAGGSALLEAMRTLFRLE
jgi:glutamyl-tRNA reductase